MKMMDETEIKYEFPNYENQCSVCLSVGRKLSLLGEYIGVFKSITSDVRNHSQTPLEDIKLCWECNAFLRRASIFQQQVSKANEMLQLRQSYLYGTQSSLTTIILNDSHPHTIYVNDLNVKVQPETKICDNNSDDDEINDNCEFGDDCTKTEEVTKESTGTTDSNPDSTDHTRDNQPRLNNISSVRESSEQKKSKNNRWAKKRALQNKKPKFKIITEYTRQCFRRVQIDDEELRCLLKSEREGVYFKSKKFKCDSCILAFSSQEMLEKHDKKFHCKLTKYTCDICTSRISSKRLLSEHIRGHYNKYVCTLCDFTCYDKSQTKSHQQKRHRKVFQCLKCELKFGSRWEFFKHYKEWHEKFVCDFCGISFKMRYCIKDHIRKQHSPFECKPCNKRWARYNGLWLHNKTSHGAHKAAYCVECDKQYRDVYRYRWHLANSARHSQHRKHRIPCPGCDKIFSKNIYMKDHYNLVHLKFYKYRCEQCDKNFIRNADLVKHTRRVHEGILPPKNKICYMCGRGFSTNKILTNHLRTHTGEKPFACSLCNARFAQSTALSAHARAIHHTVQKPTKQHSPFECKPCNKRWARYNGLWLHNKTSHGAHKAAYCVECDKQYRDVYRYRWHLANSARHSQHRKHRIPCPGCDKIFSKNIYMKDHYNLVHLKFYKYRCEQCDKNFIRNADLVKHTRRVHEGILPPKNKICYMCGRGFSTNKILTNHLRTHTGEKPFACSLCNARFAQSTALSAHARAIHHTVQKPT